MKAEDENHRAEGLTITDSARDWIRAHFAEKAQDRLVFRVTTLPTKIGFTVRAGFDAASPREPRRQEFSEIPVVVAPADWERLAGFTIDVREGCLVTLAGIRVQVAAAQNPQTRTFAVSRTVLATGTAKFSRDQADQAPILAQLLFRLEGVRSLCFRENVVTVTREGHVAWEELAPSVKKTLQAYFAHGGQAVLGNQ